MILLGQYLQFMKGNEGSFRDSTGTVRYDQYWATESPLKRYGYVNFWTLV